MKTYLLRIPPLLVFLIMGILPAVLAQRGYNSSLKLELGGLNYNEIQNDFFDPANPENSMSGGLTYIYRPGRIAEFNFSGKFYRWNLSGNSEIQTQALQSLVVLHPGKISRSWRINRITPYAGVGIGHQWHELRQEGSTASYQNFYLPVEAGIMFNLSSRWSIGVYVEYKFDFGSDIKKKLINDKKHPDVINAAGVSLSYHFGRRKQDFDFPLVKTQPHIFEREAVKIEEIRPAIKTADDPDGLFIRFKLQGAELKPVPGATITLDNQSGTSDDSGIYTFTYLASDVYNFTVTSTVHLPYSGVVELRDTNLEVNLFLEPDLHKKPAITEPVVAERPPKEPGIKDEKLPEPIPVIAKDTTPPADTIVTRHIIKEKVSTPADTLTGGIVFKPIIIYPDIDTIRIPVVFDFQPFGIPSVTSDHGVSQQLFADNQLIRSYEKKVDSLERLVMRLNNRINRLESIAVHQPQTVEATEQPRTRTTRRDRKTQPEQQPDFKSAILSAQIIAESELTEIKHEIELLSSRIQQMTNENRTALNELKEQLATTPATRQETVVWRQPPVISPARPERPATVLRDTLPESIIAESEYAESLRIEIDSLNQNQRVLFEELKKLQRQNQELLEEIANLSKIPETVEQEVIEPVRKEYAITFAINSTVVGDEHLPRLSEIANILRKAPDFMIQLSGFADATGDPEYNMVLSRRRVQAVREVLMKLGIEQKRIVEQYFGSEKASGGVNPEDRKVELRIF